MTDPQEQIEHLEYLVRELTTYPEGWMRNPEVRSMNLRGQQGRIMGRLLRSEGEFVHKTMLFSAMYDVAYDPDRWADDMDNVLSVQISNIRRKLQGTDLSIENSYGFGYRVVRT